MRVLLRIRQSRARIAAAISVALFAVFAAGVGFAPAASASTTVAQSVSHTAGKVTPDEIVLYYGGDYPNIGECLESLEEVRTNPYFAGGGCDSDGDGGFFLWYELDLPVCGSVAAPVGIIAGRIAEPAAC